MNLDVHTLGCFNSSVERVELGLREDPDAFSVEEIKNELVDF